MALCPTMLNSYEYLEILKHNDRHLNLPDLVFQQANAPIDKSEVVCFYSGPKAMGGARLASLQS